MLHFRDSCIEKAKKNIANTFRFTGMEKENKE